jgi:hypothetical protein
MTHPTVPNLRWDRSWFGKCGFNPVVSMYGRYEHTNFTSTIAENDFIEDEMRFGFKLRR